MRSRKLMQAVDALRIKNKGGIPRIGDMSLTDKTIYLAVAAKAQGGTVDIVDTNTKKEIGVTNLDGNKLNAGKDYIIDGIRILFDSSNATDIKKGTWIPATGLLLDPALLNAEFILEQDGNALIEMPITDFLGYASDTNNLFREISTSPLIRSNMEFTMKIAYPKGLSVTNLVAHNVRFEMRAHQAKK